MIQECFRHVRGIGPKTSALLKDNGFATWDDCFSREQELPFNGRRRVHFLQAIRQSLQALQVDDLYYFISAFPTEEHWRILARYLDSATFIDVETTGLSWHYSHTSVIAALHYGEIYTYRYGENLDEFLSLIDEAELLVAFNGNCFDIPFLEKTFNIPSIGCPHIDLRWIAWHCGYSGGLKHIERCMGIRRPPHLDGIDGSQAVELFSQWQMGDEQARETLVSYCAADAISARLLSERLLFEAGCWMQMTDPERLFDKIRVPVINWRGAEV